MSSADADAPTTAAFDAPDAYVRDFYDDDVDFDGGDGAEARECVPFDAPASARNDDAADADADADVADDASDDSLISLGASSPTPLDKARAENARLRERLASEEANALRATSALDVERAARAEERARFLALVRAAAPEDDRYDIDSSSRATSVVFAYASAEKTPTQRAIARFVARGASGASSHRDGGLRITFAEAEAVCEDFAVQDTILHAARSEALRRDAMLAQYQAEVESCARKARDHDEAHALLVAEVEDLRAALAQSKSEANALASEVTTANEALANAAYEAEEWKRTAAALKGLARESNDFDDVGARDGASNHILVLELECALEALTTTRSELNDVKFRLQEATSRAERAEKLEAVAAAALEASQANATSSARQTPRVATSESSRELRERLDRAEVRVAQLTKRLEAIDDDHAIEMERLRNEHERLCLNLKMMHLSNDDATEMMRLEIEDAKRDVAERVTMERDEFWQRTVKEIQQVHLNQLDSLKSKAGDELLVKEKNLAKMKTQLVRLLEEVGTS